MMRKVSVLLAILIFTTVILSCDGSLSLFSGDAHSVETIRNWGNFNSLGIRAASTGNRASDSATGYKLVGIRTDGSIESIQYDDSKGKEVTKSLYVGIFVDYDRFALVLLSPTPFNYLLTNSELSYIHAFGGNYFNDGDPYILDKKTGKFYLLDDRIDVIQLYEQGNSIAWEIGNTFYALSYTSWTGTSGLKAFRAESSGQLAVETIQLENYENVRADRYGNIYYTSSGVTYILSTTNQLNIVPTSNGYIYWGLNNIAYYFSNNNTFYYNESGNLIGSSFIPPRDGVISYLLNKFPNYRTADDIFYWGGSNVYRVHFTDPTKTEYEFHTINLSSNTNGNIAICGDYLVYLSDAEIQILDWQADITNTISLENNGNTVFVNMIKQGGDGKVYFTGIDQQRNAITGVLDEDLSYSFESTPYIQNISSIVYLSPVN